MSQRRSQKKNKVNEVVEIEHERETTIIEDRSQKCVRYFLTCMSSNVPIKRSDIIQHVFQEKPGKSFNLVLKNASEYLKTIYGLSVDLIDGDAPVKKYVISNELPYAHLISTDKSTDMKSTVLFLILAHIFMSKNNATDISVWNFLKEFGITSETTCENIGNIKTFIMQTLVKHYYIILEDRGGEYDDGEPKKKFKWGPRAEEVVSKMEILKFIGQIYDNHDLQTWSDQYKTAKEQFASCES